MFKAFLECTACGYEHTLEIPRDRIDYTPAVAAVYCPNERACPGSPATASLDIADAIPCQKCGGWIKINRKDLERGAAAWMEMTLKDEADAAAEVAEERRIERISKDFS